MPRYSVLPRQIRSGVTVSPSVTVPPSASLVRVEGDVADLTAPTEIRVEFQVSADHGATWQTYYAFGYRGPATDQPMMEFDVARFRDRRARVRLTASAPIAAGAVLEVT